MTTGSFARRSMERRDFLDQLMKEINGGEEKRGDPTFLFKLAREISEYLQQRRHNTPLHGIGEEEIGALAGSILSQIREFGRSQSEDDALVAELFARVVWSEVSYFQSELQRQEFSDQHASSMNPLL